MRGEIERDTCQPCPFTESAYDNKIGVFLQKWNGRERVVPEMRVIRKKELKEMKGSNVRKNQ